MKNFFIVAQDYKERQLMVELIGKALKNAHLIFDIAVALCPTDTNIILLIASETNEKAIRTIQMMQKFIHSHVDQKPLYAYNEAALDDYEEQD